MLYLFVKITVVFIDLVKAFTIFTFYVWTLLKLISFIIMTEFYNDFSSAVSVRCDVRSSELWWSYICRFEKWCWDFPPDALPEYHLHGVYAATLFPLLQAPEPVGSAVPELELDMYRKTVKVLQALSRLGTHFVDSRILLLALGVVLNCRAVRRFLIYRTRVIVNYMT